MIIATPNARAYVGWAVVAVLLVAGLVALGPATAQERSSTPDFVFAETSYANNCAECHGADGTGAPIPGSSEMGPALVDRDDVTAAYVDLTLRTGRMPPPGDPFDNRARAVFYSDAEREAMVAWMVQQFDLTEDIPTVAEGQVARGLEVFALNCAHCHGNTGAGGTAGQAAWTPEVNHLDPLTIVEAIRVGPFEMPAFSPDVLDQQEVDDIAAYLQAVGAESGTPVLGLVELNPVFASGFVGLLAVVLLGSLLFIGGRPTPFEVVGGREVPAPTPVRGSTPDPDPDEPDITPPPEEQP